MIKIKKQIILYILLGLIGVVCLFFTYTATNMYSSLDASIGDLCSSVLCNNEQFKNLKINGQYISSFLKNLYVTFGILGSILKLIGALLVIIIVLLVTNIVMINKANQSKD